MKSKYIKSILPLGLLLILSCAPSRQLFHSHQLSELRRSELSPPRKALEHFINAISLEEEGIYQLALTEYRRALIYDSASMEIRMGLIKNYYRLNLLENVITEARQALAIQPEFEMAKIYLGQALVESGEWAAAEKVFSDLIRKDSLNVNYRAHLAAIYIQLEKPEKAREIYLKLAEDSDNPAAVLERAGTVMLMNEYKDIASELFRQALEMNPELEEAIYSLGTIVLEEGNIDSALVCFNQALKIDPDDAQNYFSTAYLYTATGKLEQADSVLNIAVEKFPGTPKLLNLYGSVLQQLGRYDEGLEVLYESIQIDSTDTSPYITIGFIYDELDSVSKAMDIYKQAMQIDPDDALVLNNYAYLLAEEGIQLQEALQMSEKSLKLSPDNASYLDTKGWIHYKLGEYDQAEEYLRKALELADNPIMYLHLGDILRDVGRIEEAEECYRKGLEKNPNNSELRKRAEAK